LRAFRKRFGRGWDVEGGEREEVEGKEGDGGEVSFHAGRGVVWCYGRDGMLADWWDRRAWEANGRVMHGRMKERIICWI